MILYHGSYIEVEKPNLMHFRKNLDFGIGFYTTPIYNQALSWSKRFKRRGEKAIISHYRFEESAYKELKILCIDTYSEEWLDFIVSCRLAQDCTVYDLVIGGIANDKVFNTVELYFESLIDKKEAIKRLQYEKSNIQICFRSQDAIDNYLLYERSEQI